MEKIPVSTYDMKRKEEEDVARNAPLAKEEENSIAGGRNGIENIGNTCYMNTGIQV